jgi:Zn finger protein HypA/HybF involved in hydrogenase expression
LGKNCFGKYCSNHCQSEYQYKLTVEEWLRTGISPSKTNTSKSIRRWLLEKNSCCWSCGITEWNNRPIVLEVEHIDGDSTNNTPKNLQLLCPNCHSQTDTYKGRNKGGGRYSRRKRYELNKSY